MMELCLDYSHKPNWLYEVAKRMEAQIIDDKTIKLPNIVGYGYLYFTSILPGISIALLDAVFEIDIRINKPKSDNDLYILHLDLSDKTNQIEINTIKYDVGYTINLGLALLTGQIPNSYIPTIGNRTYVLHLLIDKSFFDEYVNKRRNLFIHKNSFFQNHIDSNSKILALALKDKSISDITFNTHIQGVALKILANFIQTNSKLSPNQINKSEIDAIATTKNYLKENLYNEFPSISLLSRIAGMSATKYKSLFKNINYITPKQFFIKEKLILANKLLKSKNYSSPLEIIQILNYSKAHHFKSKYFKYFGRNPSDDFVKNDI